MPETPPVVKRVRIDQGSAGGSEIAPGRGSLLRAFGAWGGKAVGTAGRGARRPAPRPQPAPEDRRVSGRHDGVECHAWVGWKTFRRFHMNDALVIDVSRGGARIFLDAAPPPRRPVWVFLETPGLNTIVKARVLDVRTTAQGQCAIRVEFSEPCPFAFFEAAVCGLAASNPKARIAPAPRAAAGRY